MGILRGRDAAAGPGSTVALGAATTSTPVVDPDEAASTVIPRLTGRRWESVADIPVCRDGVLVGMLRLEDVLAADPSATVADIMDPDPPRVAPGVDQEMAAWTMIRHGERGLAVVDAEGRHLGVIPPHTMLGALLRAHTEDIARFSGTVAGRGGGVATAGESVARRVMHRLPWLAIGLFGAMVSAWLVGESEDELTRTIQLAFFLPAIVYMADAVGTQTEVIVVRSLSLGVPISRMATREILAGAAIGAAVAVAFAPFCFFVFGDGDVALAVSLALFVSSATAGVVALVLPWALSSLGFDPAFGSGPLSTVVQDLLSIAVYLGLAHAIIA